MMNQLNYKYQKALDIDEMMFEYIEDSKLIDIEINLFNESDFIINKEGNILKEFDKKE